MQKLGPLVFILLTLGAGVRAQDYKTFPKAHVDDATFAEAIVSFHKLVNAIEVGGSLGEYRRQLVDAKTDFDAPIARFPDCAQRGDLAEAMRDYMIAADAWALGIQYDGIPTKTDFYRDLNKRYKLGIEPRRGRKVKYDVIVRMIWDVAAARLKHAIKLQDE
jgi:hypothetical protein